MQRVTTGRSSLWGRVWEGMQGGCYAFEVLQGEKKSLAEQFQQVDDSSGGKDNAYFFFGDHYHDISPSLHHAGQVSNLGLCVGLSGDATLDVQTNVFYSFRIAPSSFDF